MRDAVVQHLEETERSADTRADTGSEMAVGLLVLAVGCSEISAGAERSGALRDDGC